MRALLWAVAVAATPPSGQTVVDEMLQPGCPALFARLTPAFQKAHPLDTWSSFCGAFASGGKPTGITTLNADAKAATYEVAFASRTAELSLGFDAQGRVEMLNVRPSTRAAEARTRFRWPLKGPTLVFWGGADAALNHHVAVPRQQRATDLIVVDADGADHRGDGRSNTDYFAFGAEVLAAADGKVIAAVDGVPENEPGLMDNTLVPGNVVAIEHAPGEYGHYCHLQRGSVRVKVGDRVKAGQVIGLLGNTGNSSQPHLHFHVQTSARMAEGVGLEPLFDGVCLKDGGAQKPYRLKKGDIIVPCSPP